MQYYVQSTYKQLMIQCFQYARLHLGMQNKLGLQGLFGTETKSYLKRGLNHFEEKKKLACDN